MRLQALIAAVLVGCLVEGCALLKTTSSQSSPTVLTVTNVQTATAGPRLIHGTVYISMAHDPRW